MNWTGRDGPTHHISVNVPTKEALLVDLETRFRKGQGFTVGTLNLDHVVKLKRDAGFAATYGAQTHITADGNPIVWLSHLAGQHDIRLVPGSELVLPVAELASSLKMPVGFFGATETSLQEAAVGLNKACPGTDVVMTRAPAMGFDPEGPDADAAIAHIKESGARIVFVALGAPKQERFAVRAHAALPEVGFLSIGAGLDFISGAQTRAPAWVRALALEWLWRMLGNPRRLVGRYASCFMLLPGLFLRALSARRQAGASS